jgi:hypothetical protein
MDQRLYIYIIWIKKIGTMYIKNITHGIIQ